MKTKNILAMIAGALSLFALIDGLPYGYFTFLRFAVCIVATYIAYQSYEENRSSFWIWSFGFIAVLFNPLIPIYLKREQWVPIDLVVGIFFLLATFFLRDKRDN